MEPYYYSRMNKTYQSAYHAMKTGLMELRPSFPVPLLEGRELAASRVIVEEANEGESEPQGNP